MAQMATNSDLKAGLAAIVTNSQAVEHYEISRYGTLIAWAEEPVLTTNLNEEKAANAKLSSVALRKGVNQKASAAQGGCTLTMQGKAPNALCDLSTPKALALPPQRFASRGSEAFST